MYPFPGAIKAVGNRWHNPRLHQAQRSHRRAHTHLIEHQRNLQHLIVVPLALIQFLLLDRDRRIPDDQLFDTGATPLLVVMDAISPATYPQANHCRDG